MQTAATDTLDRIRLVSLFTLVSRMIALSLLAIGTAMAAPQDRQHDDIVDVARSAGSFETLLAAVDAAGLTETLRGKGPFTVFAPTDEAFERLAPGTVESLLRPENRQQLIELLTFHVVPGRIEASDLLTRPVAPTVNGANLPIGLSIAGATVVKTDVEASNGIIHVVDRVLEQPVTRAEMPSAASLIALAINRGAPLYNDGQPAACAAIYHVAATSILALDENLPKGAAHALHSALSKSSRTNDAVERAWIMREGLDEALRVLVDAPERPTRMEVDATRI